MIPGAGGKELGKWVSFTLGGVMGVTHFARRGVTLPGWDKGASLTLPGWSKEASLGWDKGASLTLPGWSKEALLGWDKGAYLTLPGVE